MNTAVTGREVTSSTLTVRQLSVAAPGGKPIVEAISLNLEPGQITVLFGPSGAGKSTLVAALVDPDRLSARGFRVEFAERQAAGDCAFVPQHAALLDHIDIRQNVQLACRTGSADEWLRALGLELATLRGRRVSTLSGGQARRVALARALASNRETLVLDEPSTGLDVEASHSLARLLRAQASARGVAVFVVTHDPVFGADVGDRFVFMAPGQAQLAGLGEAPPVDDRQRLRGWVTTRLEAQLAACVEAEERHVGAPRGYRTASALRVFGRSLYRLIQPYQVREAFRVLLHVMQRALVRPLAFYAVVGVLLGFTILYIVAKISADVPVSTMLRLVGGTYILALAPPLSAVLFASASGSAVSAWLGGLELGQQTTALRGVGVSADDYLWPGTWWALVSGYVACATVLTLAMVAGGGIMFWLYDAPHAWAVLTSDVLDPAPERLPYRTRAAWLIGVYATGIATLVVARSSGDRVSAAQVTDAMTSVVIRSTLLVVVVELVSVLWLFQLIGR